MTQALYTVLLFVSALVTACGKAPVDVSPITAVQVVDASVTQQFAYAQATQICTALESWDSSKTNVQFPGDPASNNVYLFKASAITLNGVVLTDYTLNVAVSGTHYCTVTISGGKMVSCQ